MITFKWLIKTLSAKGLLVVASLILLTQFYFLPPPVRIQPAFATSEADLVVSKWGPEAISTTCGSRRFMWYITVFNQGSAAAENVTVVDTLPAGVKYVRDTSDVPKKKSGNTITWNLGRLDPGTGVYFWVEVRIRNGVPADTVLTNQVDVSTSSPEGDLTNNHAETDTRVEAGKGAEVWVEKIGPGSIYPGSYMVYTINYGNGDWHCEWPLDVANAEDVTITDIMSNWDENGNMLPNHFSYVSDTSGFPRSGTGTIDDPIVWTVGTLPANHCGSFEVTVYVHADAPDGLTLSNDAIISSGTKECDARNNDYEVDTPVERRGSIGDYVWHDVDRDGIQDTDESGINSVVVQLYEDEDGDGVIDAEDGLLQTTTTANSPMTGEPGWYLFSGLAGGDYIVKVADTNFVSGGTLQHHSPTIPDAGTDDTVDSDGHPVTHEAAVTLASGESNITIDFGFSDCALGDRVWHDEDDDGAQTGTSDQQGFNGVDVHLYDSDGDDNFEPGGDDALLYTTTTISGTSQIPDGFPNGIYGFDMSLLGAGEYWVWVDENTLPNPGTGMQWARTTDNPQKVTYTGADDFSIDFGYVAESIPTVVTLSSFVAKSRAGGFARGLWLGLTGLTLAAGGLFWAKRRAS